MRMWMVDVKLMCDRHLIAEHCECHMFVGTLNKHMKVDGYLRENCLEYKSLHKRHDELAEEMKRRGFNHHNKVLPELDYWYFDNNRAVIFSVVDRVKALKLLLTRVDRCFGKSKNRCENE